MKNNGGNWCTKLKHINYVLNVGNYVSTQKMIHFIIIFSCLENFECLS